VSCVHVWSSDIIRPCLNVIDLLCTAPSISAKHPSSSLGLLCLLCNWHDVDWNTIETHALQQILGILVDIKLTALAVLGEVEGRDFRNILILSLSLFFLKLERDTSDWATLDTLHEMGGVSGDLKQLR